MAPSPQPEEKPSRGPVLVAAAGLGALLLLLWFRSGPGPTESAPEAPPPAPSTEPATPEPPPAPVLDPGGARNPELPSLRTSDLPGTGLPLGAAPPPGSAAAALLAEPEDAGNARRVVGPMRAAMEMVFSANGDPGDPYAVQALTSLRARQPMLEQCYQRALVGQPLMRGNVVLRINVDAVGAVSNVEAQTPGGSGGTEAFQRAMTELRSCLDGAVRGTSFPPPPDGGTTLSGLLMLQAEPEQR